MRAVKLKIRVRSGRQASLTASESLGTHSTNRPKSAPPRNGAGRRNRVGGGLLRCSPPRALTVDWLGRRSQLETARFTRNLGAKFKPLGFEGRRHVF